MKDEFTRMVSLLGEDAFEILQKSHIAVFGCGGVGSYAAEALARCAVGEITLVDADCVDISNINRQLIALHSTVGKPKVQIQKERILDINPRCVVNDMRIFYDDKSDLKLDFNYIIDAIDSVPSKLHLICEAKKCGVPILSAMGTGNKCDPSKLVITDISKTEYCPLAKKIRVALRKENINHVDVIYSTETPKVRCHPPASVAFVPSVAGLMMAGEVVNRLTENIN